MRRRWYVLMSHLDELLGDYPRQMTLRQVAEVLGITPRTVSNWLSAGDLPGYKLPGGWLILREELRDYLKEHSSRPDDEDDGTPTKS